MAIAVEERVRDVRDVLAVLESLRHHFPAWTVWCDARREWTATRSPGSGEQPSSGGHLIWVRSTSPDDLATRIASQRNEAT